MDGYVYKSSGGMAAYPHRQSPIAVYAKTVRRTFFRCGKAPPGRQHLLCMVSCYDHKTGTVPQPRILMRLVRTRCENHRRSPSRMTSRDDIR